MFNFTKLGRKKRGGKLEKLKSINSSDRPVWKGYYSFIWCTFHSLGRNHRTLNRVILNETAMLWPEIDARFTNGIGSSVSPFGLADVTCPSYGNQDVLYETNGCQGFSLRQITIISLPDKQPKMKLKYKAKHFIIKNIVK